MFIISKPCPYATLGPEYRPYCKYRDYKNVCWAPDTTFPACPALP